MDKRKKDWIALRPEQRNCLEWPDFLKWGRTRNVEVCREDPSFSIGLVTTVMQEPETKECYHIAKYTKENHPAHRVVDRFDWIFAIDDTSTTKKKEIKNLISNGKKKIRLTLKTAVDPLSSTKRWAVEEKVVSVKIKEKKCGFELVHFYCKDENGSVKDRILIWAVETDAAPESSQRLYRGDELLEVNGVPVEGKKLAQIYKLIFATIPSMVELKIKEIDQERVVPSAPPQEIQLVNSPDLTIPENQTQETEEHALDERPSPARPETSSNFHKDSERLIHASQEESSNGGLGPTRLPRDKNRDVRNNLGYVNTPDGTPEPSRKTYPKSIEQSASTYKMCISCATMRKTRLSDDRNQWPIYKIEAACYEEMCKLLDLHDDLTGVSLLVALGCFSNTDVSAIKLKFSNTGGVGTAKFAVDRWGNQDSTHNVGAFKEIVKNKMKRQDVIDEIEKWEKMNVCHGCGVKLKEKN